MQCVRAAASAPAALAVLAASCACASVGAKAGWLANALDVAPNHAGLVMGFATMVCAHSSSAIAITMVCPRVSHAVIAAMIQTHTPTNVTHSTLHTHTHRQMVVRMGFIGGGRCKVSILPAIVAANVASSAALAAFLGGSAGSALGGLALCAAAALYSARCSDEPIVT